MTAQSDVGRLRAEILADPASTTARLVYADHLIELGDPRGELIQAQCQFEKLDWDDPHRRAIDERIADLLAAHETEWTRDVRALGFDDHLQQVTLRRGFVERVSLAAKHVAGRVPQLRAVTPLRELHVFAKDDVGLDDVGRAGATLEALAFRGASQSAGRAIALRLPAWPYDGKLATLHVVSADAAAAIARTPALSTLRQLRIGSIEATGMASLAAAPHLAGLHTLELPLGNLGAAGIAALARGKLTGLARLQLEHGRIGGGEIAVLGQAAFASQLLQLRVHHNSLGLAGARELAARFPALELLDVESTNLGCDGALALLASRQLPALRSLDLSRNGFDHGLAAAIDAIEIPRLRHLACMHNLLGAPVAAAIARSRQLAGLRSLDLSDNPLGDAGVLALAATARLPGLEVLRLKHTAVGARGLAGLAHSELGARVRALDLARNAVDDHGLAGLLARSASLDLLDSLDLGDSALTLDGVAALVASPLAARIKHLTLTGLPAGALAPLLAAELPQLRSLVADRFDDAAARLLASARGLPKLHSIVFVARELTDAGAGALAASPHLQRVLWLELAAPAVTDVGRAVLRRRFGHHVAASSGTSLSAFGNFGRRV